MTPSFKSLKLEDIKELQGLVADSIESVGPGLRLLDSSVLLGGSTIDLLAVDAAGVLTLVALGLQADDETMLRGLEAYSWCMEDPDALRRLYPAAQLSSSEPPRVVFIAERIPEAFLRKIRHLRFHRVDCLEFRLGLHFSVVGEVRGTGAPESAPARSERGPSASAPGRPDGRAEAPFRRDAPRGGPRVRRDRPPAGGEETPRAEPVGERESRRSVPQAASDVDEAKVRAVRDYLQREFPTAVIYDFFSHEHGVQMFHLQDSYGALVHSAAVSVDVLADLRETELSNFLEKHKLARVLRQAGTAGVAVTTSGLKVERR
jgi:hypothetical protein